MATQYKPGDLFRANNAGKKKTTEKMMKRMKGAVKDTGSFEGKSNALGHGGRAAQLRSQGVPGGVIGNLARAAQAAPGQANFHGKKAVAKKRKVASPDKENMGMAFKRKKKAGFDAKEGDKEEKRAEKHRKSDLDEREEKHAEKRHKASGMCEKCKAAHEKHSKKKER